MTDLPGALPLQQISDDPSGEAIIDDALLAIRKHFNMPVAYLSRFDGERLVFRNVSAPGLEELIKPGDEMAISEAYCPHVLKGDLPTLIPDTADVPKCQRMPITAEVPIRSHISLPIKLEDGTPFGMFCCLSPEPNPTLNPRDLSVMSTFAGLVTRQVRKDHHEQARTALRLDALSAMLEAGEFHPVYQPLVRLDTGAVVGVEALTRFNSDLGPDHWFAEAAELGLGLELERRTLAAALAGFPDIPAPLYLSLNASPELICSGELGALLPRESRDRLVIEVTERSFADDEDHFLHEVSRLHASGVRIAIDDVGAGYSGLQRLSMICPDILKVDRALVTGIQDSLSQRAIVAALVHFAHETGATVLVEGVEHQNEALVLLGLGVDLAQGWHFARPAPLDALNLTDRTTGTG